MPALPTKIGWTIGLLFGTAFAILAWAVLGHNTLGDGSLSDLDRRIAFEMRDFGHDHELVRGLMIGFTELGGIKGIFALACLGLLWELGHRRFMMACAWIAIVAGGALLNQGLKTVLDRPRPEEALRDPWVKETNQSFPSGHAMGSMICFGMIGYVYCLSKHRRRSKIAACVALAILIFLVGFSRIFLRAHWASDVMAGFTVGLAWLAAGIGMVETRRRRKLTLTTAPSLKVHAAP